MVQEITVRNYRLSKAMKIYKYKTDSDYIRLTTCFKIKQICLYIDMLRSTVHPQDL